MAVNMKKVGERLRNRFSIINRFGRPPPALSLTIYFCSRGMHESVYEKEVEEEVRSTEPPALAKVSPKPHEYWEPDPETGVFVPASEQNSEEPAVTCTSTEGSVLEEKAFFRPQEDLEPPPPESFSGDIPPVDPFADPS